MKKSVKRNELSLKEQIESLEVAANMLHMNDASRIEMLEKFYKLHNISPDFLPKYERNGSKQLVSLTSLIKVYKLNITAVKFNRLMIQNGLLEERERPSSKGGIKKFKALTKKGLNFGENVISPKNQREVRPMYYKDTFIELYKLIYPNYEIQ